MVGRPEPIDARPHVAMGRRGDGVATEIFGRRFRIQTNEFGSYEENMPSLAAAQSLAEVKAHRWPDPDWWDFKPVRSVIRDMNRDRPAKHVRFRMGAVFEVAWQLRRDGELPLRDPPNPRSRPT